MAQAALSGEVSGFFIPHHRLHHLRPFLQLDLPTWLQAAQPSPPPVGSEWMDAELRRSSWRTSRGRQLHWLPLGLGVVTTDSQGLQIRGQRRISEMIVK